MRLGWIGLGQKSTFHAAAAGSLGLDMAAVVHTPDRERSHFAAKFSIAREFDTVDELLASNSVDAVCIESFQSRRADDAIACLRTGIAVLIESPMAADADAAREVWCAAEATSTPLMVAHGWRFDAEVRWLKAQYQAGALGGTLRAVVHHDDRAIIDAVDRARFLLGDPEPSSVYAHFGVTCGRLCGVIVVSWNNGAATVVESQQEHSRPLYSLDNAYAPQMEHFAECVQRRVQPSVNGAHGYLGQCIVDAAHASARIGKVIDL